MSKIQTGLKEVDILTDSNLKWIFLTSKKKTVIFIKAHPTHSHTHILSSSLYTCIHYYLTLSALTRPICCLYTCSKELPQTEIHHYLSCTFCTTHSYTELNSCVNVPRQERTTGGWLSISESTGLFWGISLAHLFDPKHSALSPPEQCSGALGRNQDVILNWLTEKSLPGSLFLVLLYLSLTPTVSLLCCSFFTKASLILVMPQQDVPRRTVL